jgi:anti-sigma B factor antagonist
MRSQTLTMSVRNAAEGVCVIDIQGEVTVTAEKSLMDAHTHATSSGAKAIVLNFERLDYMNSSGIGLLVTLLIRANRQNQRLLVYGLSDHYRHIFELTRLNEAIGIYEDEKQALASLGAN